jgi:hypothetical protein
MFADIPTRKAARETGAERRGVGNNHDCSGVDSRRLALGVTEEVEEEKGEEKKR